ncbi:uncharacterized protein [Physeter macrocephalus]|uniref:Uncharacterized protein n=1 Tax=Physeter macrocephalus TaxID=9755 RepID=A0A9W2WN88_PHYMC|nr:uncharacterized protein LOC129392108 [Physeter catodon]
MADPGEPAGGSSCRFPALPGVPATAHLRGCGLRALGSAVLIMRPARVRVVPRLRSLWRHRGLQLQWRRRPSGASPSPDSRRSGPPPPANSWPGSRDRGARPRLRPTPDPGRAAPRSTCPLPGPGGRLGAERAAEKTNLSVERGSLFARFLFLGHSGVAAFWKERTRALRSQAPLSPAPLPDSAVWVATCGPLCLSRLSPRRNVSGTLLTHKSKPTPCLGLKGVLQFSWPKDSLSPSPSLQWTPQVHRPHLAWSRSGPDHLPQLQKSPDGVKQSCTVKGINCHCLLMKVLYQIFYSLSKFYLVLLYHPFLIHIFL